MAYGVKPKECCNDCMSWSFCLLYGRSCDLRPKADPESIKVIEKSLKRFAGAIKRLGER